MNYLVTGATGFIGPYVLKHLIAKGHHCRCLVRKGKESGLPQDAKIEAFTGDITAPESLKGIGENIDCLLHLATLGHMSNFTVTESMFQKINVEGTKNIMAEALDAGIPRIVHCSTVAAMGICDEVPATETTPCNPHHPYGRSKRDAENLVLQMVREKGLPACIIRFSMVYGPGDPRDILRLTRMAKKRFFPKIGSRPKLTPLIHVDDAVDGLLLAAEKGRAGEVYPLTNKASEPFDRIIQILQDALGVASIPVYIPEWFALSMASAIEKTFLVAGKTPPIARKNIESTLADRVFSIQKAQTELGFEPKIDPATGLKQTVLWYKEQGWI